MREPAIKAALLAAIDGAGSGLLHRVATHGIVCLTSAARIR
jgi:hypothetical protein